MVRRNILIFHLGALGDFVLTWPLALALSRLHPQSRIVYVTHGQKGALAEKALGVEWNDIEAGWHHLYSSPEALPAGAMKLLSGAHSIYSFIAGADDAWSAHAQRLAPEAELCCIEPTPPPGFDGHATDHLIMQLSARPAIANGLEAMVRSMGQRGVGRRGGAGRGVVIHPGSGSMDKCWPAEQFAGLARMFQDAGREVGVLLGEVEAERWPSAAVEPFAELAEIVRPATYLDLMRHLEERELFIGNDSGPGHLAGVLGVPTFCIFGPSDPVVWRPLGPDVHALRRQPLETLGADEVWEWIRAERRAGVSG